MRAAGQRTVRSNTEMLRNFDWKQYLENYPQLRQHSITTKQASENHYLSTGRPQGWVGRKLRILLRYTAGTGLINQHYSHIAAFVLSQLLGAEIVLPPALHRSSFEHVFSVFKGQSAVQWAFAPLESLYDVEAIVKTWKKEGLIVHRTPPVRHMPDLSQPQTAFPSYVRDGGPASVPDFLAARVHNVFGQNLPAQALVARAHAAILDTVQMALLLDPDLDVSTVAVDFPCTFFMISAISSHDLFRKTVRTLQWAPALRHLADNVIDGMAHKLGTRQYNGVHLRIEKDAETWARILGGRDAVRARYREAMRLAHFDGRTPLYIASALLTYEGGHQDLQQVVQNLTDEGLTSGAVYKEMFLSQEDTRQLHSEQKGLLDFLILANSGAFVGFGPSTYSFFLAEHRSLQGAKPERSVLVDGSQIGTDPLFRSAGVLTEPASGWATAEAVGSSIHQENSQQSLPEVIAAEARKTAAQ